MTEAFNIAEDVFASLPPLYGLILRKSLTNHTIMYSIVRFELSYNSFISYSHAVEWDEA